MTTRKAEDPQHATARSLGERARANRDAVAAAPGGAARAPGVRELARWAITTDSAALTEDDLDTDALTWDMRRRVDTAA
ncbi:hypothetical protein, partial [Nocardia brasiliensis]|uniref:hypothetical protein n=1 Tax=Nocardia brasiliensis TaxID=37326 RepID=UPI002456C839